MSLSKSAARRPSGSIEPCRPSKAVSPPSGLLWVHEIKHDGFRLMVRQEGSRIRCFTDWANRFPAIVEAAKRVMAQSFLIDGEAVVCRPDGLSDFDALRFGRRADEVTLVAFDLIELQADDLRDEPARTTKAAARKVAGPQRRGDHLQRPPEPRRRGRVRPCLPPRPRTHRLETSGLAVSEWPIKDVTQL